MPRRSRVGLVEVACLDTLTAAFWQASRGKCLRDDVQRFGANLDAELARLSDDISSGRAPEGRWTSFRIYDPKPRLILALCVEVAVAEAPSNPRRWPTYAPREFL